MRQPRPTAASVERAAGSAAASPGRRSSLFLLPGGRPLPHVRPLPDRPGHPLQPLRLERARTAHRLHRARQLPRAPSPTSCSATPSGTTGSSSSCRCCCRSRSPSAWPCCSTSSCPVGPCCARCSSPRTSCPRWSPASCGGRSCGPTACSTRASTAIGAEGLIHEWLADPDIVLYSLFFVISWKYFGFHMILLPRRPPADPQGARARRPLVDGATAWQRFRHVTLPLLGPTIRVSVFLSIIGALQLFDLVWVTTRGGPIGASSTMATYLYEQFRKSLFGYASAVSIVIFALCLVIALAYQRFVHAPRPPGSWSRCVSRRTLTQPRALSRWRCVVLAVVIIPLTFSVLGGFRTSLPARRRTRSACRTRGSGRTTARSSPIRHVLAAGPQQHGDRPAHRGRRAAGRFAGRLRHRPLLVQGPRAGLRPVHARAAVPRRRGDPAAVHHAARARAAQQPARRRPAAGGVRPADRDHRDAAVLPGDSRPSCRTPRRSTGAGRSASTGRSCSRCRGRCSARSP